MKIQMMPIGLAICLLSFSARADDVPKQCAEIDKGYSEAILYSTNRQAQLAKETQPLLEQMSKLADLAKEPNVPIGKQLTPEQLDDFQKIRAQLVYLQTEAFVASSRERDLGILFNLCLASAESESLTESYIGDHGQLDDQFSTWIEAQYDKSPHKEYLHLLDHLQGLYPTEWSKQMQQMQQLQQQGAGSKGNKG